MLKFSPINRSSGFTLIEMMIVVVIVAILATIALPAYQNSIRKAKRSDAMDALMTIQQSQERYRANHSSYASTVTGTSTGLGLSAVSLESYYNLSISGASQTGYTANAVAVSSLSQAQDTDCTTMTIAVSSLNPRGLKTPSTCW